MQSRYALWIGLALVALVGALAWWLGDARASGARGATESPATAASGEPPQLLAQPAEVPPEARELPTASRVETPIEQFEPSTARHEPVSSWWGLALDGESETPLPAATFAVLRSDPFDGGGREPFRRVGSDGRFEAALASWNDEAILAVRCSGYATSYAKSSSGIAPSRSEPRRILLWRAAELAVRVESADAGTGVSAWAETWNLIQSDGSRFCGWKQPRWRAVVGADGTWVIAGLPAKVELTIDAECAGRLVRREKLVLEPGERRELVWRLGEGATIEGRAVDPEGRGVAGLEVWLLDSATFGRYFQPHMDDRLLGRATTEADGSFALGDIAPGSYLVGPSPRVPYLDAHKGIAPVGTSVTIGPDDRVVSVTITCWRKLAIRGRVLTPDGRPASEATVFAQSEGVFCYDDTVEGDFVIEPLVPGTYTVYAQGATAEEGSSELVQVRAGEPGVELHLHGGSSITVRVLDPERQPVREVFVRLLPEDDRPDNWPMKATDARGIATFEGVVPGRYLLRAQVAAQLALRTDLVVAAGTPIEDLELVAMPAATLTMRHPEADAECGYLVRWNGHALDGGAFEGPTAEVVVPPGELEVEKLGWSGMNVRVLETKHVRLAAGEHGTLEFAPSPR